MDIVRIINVFLARIINLFRNSTPSTPIPKDEAGTGSRVKISPEVSEALSRKRPVVAIESAMLSNGLPYPQNLLAVKELEAIVRRNGAVPAVVAILDGVPCIGLSEEELKGLAYVDAQTTACRDIAHVIAKRERGGTSVSATMFLANMVGIPIVVNCGISNIPSDLTELGRTSVAVVSTGAILADDTPRMLEYLEFQGVCAAAFQTSEFPTFETKSSNCQAPCRLDSIEECARLIDAHNAIMLRTGIFIAVNIPDSVKSAQGPSAMMKATSEARALNLTGDDKNEFVKVKTEDVKYFLRMNFIASVGAQIAVSLSQQQNEG